MTESTEFPATVDGLLNECVAIYEKVIRGVEHEATENKERAYGGYIRAKKGNLVEEIAKRLIQAAWLSKNGNTGRLSLNDTKKFRIPIKEDYIRTIKNKEIREFVQANAKNYYVNHGLDVHVFVNGKLILAVECKSFTENAMLKRIIFDSYLLKTRFPDLRFALVQLESQLTGDYSALNQVTYGSHSTHTLLSYFDVDINIFTLLKGKRNVDRPIHKPGFYKPLEKQSLTKAVERIGNYIPLYAKKQIKCR